MLRAGFRFAPFKSRLIAGYRDVINPFEPLLESLPHRRTLLDLGCGNGLFLLYAAMRGRIRLGAGIDNSAQLTGIAEQAAARIAALHPARMPPLSFTACASIEEWPRRQFDTVALVDVMHHVPPALQMAFLNAAGQRVRAGGRLLYKDMCARPRWRAFANQAHDLLVAQEWVHCLPIERVIEWGARNRYTLARHQAYTKWWYGHELLVLDKPAAARAMPEGERR